MSEQRMSRKELHQPDQIQQWLYAISNFIYKMRKWFIIGGIAVVIAMITVFSGMQYYQSEQIEQANQFYSAQKLLNESFSLDENQQPAMNALHELLKAYPDSVYGAVTLMHLGELHVKQKQWSQAEENYKKAMEHPKAIASMLNAAKLSLAVVYENQQQWEAANQIIQSIEGENWKDVRWKNLARIALVRGDKATAKANLEQLIKDTPQSVFKQEAETILLTLNQ